MGCGSSSQRIVGFSSRANRNPITNSNPDPNPNPVYLCRERTELIRSASDRRYEAAAAHVAYLRSISALGESLRQFAVNELATSAPGSPVLTLPPSSKGKSKAGSDSGSSTVTPLSHSLSFEDDEEERSLNLNSSTATPLTHDLSVEGLEKRREEKPQSTTSRKLEEDSRSSLKMNNNMATSNAMPSPTRNYYPYEYDYTYGYGFGYGYGYGYETTNSNPNFDDQPGPSKPATPPMPVQDSSGWEFFDPFSNYDQFMERYPYLNSNSNSNSNSYRSSPDLNKVRQREGIPDLEDEIKFEEKQKEVEREEQNEIEREKEKQMEIEKERERQKQKEIEIERQKQEKGKEKEKEDEKDNGISMDPSTSATMEKTISTEEGPGGKNKDVRFEDEKATKASTSDSGSHVLVAVEVRDLDEVIEEIKEQFDSIADCAKEVTDMLEVGKVPHCSSTLGGKSFASCFSVFQFFLFCYLI